MLTKSVRRVLLVVGLGWAGYIAAQAGLTYFATRDAVDSAVREAATRYRRHLTAGVFTDTMLAEVRDSVARVAERGGLPVQARDVTVTANGSGIWATVHCAYPIFKHQGTDFLVVPLSVSADAGFQS
jgi:hypothetical protein